MNDIVKDEIESLRFIYPELDFNSDSSTIFLNIPVKLVNKLTIKDGKNNKSIEVDNLPSIKLRISIPETYPYESPPVIELDNVSKWIDEDKLKEIYTELFQIWENFKDAVIYSYIDYIKTNSELAFGIFNDDLFEINDDDLLLYFMNENESANELIFNELTILCEICQNEEKGISSTQFIDCGHIFCNGCLNDYFSHIIKRGEVENFHCPSIECTNERSKILNLMYNQAENGDIKDFNKFKHDFFQLPIQITTLKRFLKDLKLIERYEKLFYRETILKYRRYFPNRVAECSRSSCATMFLKTNPDSKLAICPNCEFAFCSDCFHSWHGEINPCSIYMRKIPVETIEKWIENNGNNSKLQTIDQREVCSNIAFKFGRKIIELSVNEYLSDLQFEELIKSGDANIVKCPQCSTFIQKADGCNKMTCLKCNVFFCNICCERLNKSDPYEHFNNPMNRCFGKLFEGMITEE